MSNSPVSPTLFTTLLVSTNRCRHIRRGRKDLTSYYSFYWNKADTIRCSVVPQESGWIVEIHDSKKNTCHFSKKFAEPSDVRSLIWGVVNNEDNDLAAVIAGAWRIFFGKK